MKLNNEVTILHEIEAGLPQSTVLEPVLYTLFAAVLPSTESTLRAAYADVTIVMTRNDLVSIASYRLQQNLGKVSTGLNKWRMKANQTQAVEINFTLRKDSSLPVTLNH